MQLRQLGPLGPVSALSLGGGGIGAVWGTTTRSEAVATVRAAVAAGITLLDLAPLYGSAEEVVGETFDGELPDGVRVITKCRLGNPPAEQVYDNLSKSLDQSLTRLRLTSVDALVLHGALVTSAPDVAGDPELGIPALTSVDRYRTAVVPALERLVDERRIASWGINAMVLPPEVLEIQPRPGVAECVTNVMGTPGGNVPFDEHVGMHDRIATMSAAGVGVMGIRAVQAGALVDVPDRELDALESRDHQRAARFRALAHDLGTTAATLAHRYALSMENVGTVVLGVKNREELEECLVAEAAGPLSPEVLAAIAETATNRR